MSTEEKAENICRSIGIAMYVQKEDADMQKENRDWGHEKKQE